MAGDSRPYGGVRLIVDTSAWTAIRRSKRLGNTPPEWTDAMIGGQFLTSPVVRLELLHSTRSAAEFEALDDLLGYFGLIPVSKGAFRTAERAIRELAAFGEGYHRVGVADALIAASAHERGVGVLHYNHVHYDKLRRVLRFESVPLAPPGTFERT
jgi:predicted nucleic acid-binding protein